MTAPPDPELGDPWWYDRNHELVARQALSGDHRCDVTVVGGGVAGLHAALRLAASGARVVLVERETCGSRMSGRSSGFVTPDSELELNPLIARFGAEEAATLWEIASTGVQRILHTIRAHQIECDLVDPLPSLFVGIGDEGTKAILGEASARGSIGYEFALFDESSLPQIHPGGYQAGVCYGGTCAMDPLAYCNGLRDVLLDRGVRIFEDSPVVAIEGSTVVGEHGRVHGDQAVVCVDRLPAELNARASQQVYHAQTFVAVSAPLSPAQIKALFPRRRFQVWDSTLFYSYYRLTGDDRLLLGGSEACVTFSKDEARSPRVILAVIESFRKRFPELADLHFERWWPGLIDVTRDLLPVAAADPENPDVQYVLGCSGLPWAAWCGEHVASRIVSPRSEDYSRFFGWSREALVPQTLQSVIGKKISFALDILDVKRKRKARAR